MGVYALKNNTLRICEEKVNMLINMHAITFKTLHMHRVGLPDGSYTLVPAGDDAGADEELYHSVAEQDPDQDPEVSPADLASEGKPRFMH